MAKQKNFPRVCLHTPEQPTRKIGTWSNKYYGCGRINRLEMNACGISIVSNMEFSW